MKQITYNQLEENQGAIQCPKCLKIFVYEQQQNILTCPYCMYNLKQFNLQKTNSQLSQVIQVLLKSILYFIKDQGVGVVVFHKNKKYIIFKKNNAGVIQEILNTLQNYDSLYNGQIVELDLKIEENNGKSGEFIGRSSDNNEPNSINNINN